MVRDHSGKERNKMHYKYGEVAEVSNSHQEAWPSNSPVWVPRDAAASTGIRGATVY